MNFAVSPRIAQVFYAISLIAWGVQHFIYIEFIAGRAPKWPSWMPLQAPLAYVSGAMLVLTGLSIILNRKASLMAAITGFVVLVWAGLRNIIALAISLDYGILLTNTNKSMFVGFGALLVASSLIQSEPTGIEKAADKLAFLTRYAIGIFLFASGIQHFLFADFVKFLMPTWIPGAMFWTYFAAVALIAGGIGLITGIQGRLAALLSAWMIFIWLLVLHIPRAVAAMNDGNEWTAVFEALGVSAILFLLYHRWDSLKTSRQ